MTCNKFRFDSLYIYQHVMVIQLYADGYDTIDSIRLYKTTLLT